MKKIISRFLMVVFIAVLMLSACIAVFAQETDESDQIVSEDEQISEEQTENPEPMYDISTCIIKCDENVLYDGSVKCPELTVYYGDLLLTEGKDYTVLYDNNINPGTAIARVEGLGQYYGTMEKTFEIVKKLVKPTLSISNNEASGKLVITWKKVTGADYYIVYRANSKSGEYKQIASTDKLSYTDKSAKVSKLYYYKVKAVKRDFEKASSAMSSYVYRRCDIARPTIKVGNVADTGKPKVTWSKVEGADEYLIYRATSKNGTYKKMYTTSGTSYINTSASSGKAYYYKVKAIDKDMSAANSAFSAVHLRTCDLPRTTATATSVASTGKPKISWKAVKGAEYYWLYSSTSRNGTYKRICVTSKTTVTNTSAEVGKTYYYKVIAADADNSAANSAYSDIVLRTCDIAKPQIKMTDNLKTGKPTVKWSKVTGADKYVVYRATSKNGTYTKMYTTSNTTYINTSAKTGYTYYYKIKAIDTDKSAANSAYSNIVSTYVIDPNKKMVALTFDDGPGPYTDEIVECLKENRAHATFFVLGERVDYYPGILKEAYKNGNEIGNHSYSHPILTNLSSSGIKSQMSKTDSEIKSEIGIKAPTMRPPGGGVNSTVRESVGKPIIYWSIDTLDWKTRSKSATINSVMNNVKDGDIVLMHDIHYPTMEAALELIPKLKKAGYQLVTVSEMAKYKGYTLKNGTVYYSFR